MALPQCSSTKFPKAECDVYSVHKIKLWMEGSGDTYDLHINQLRRALGSASPESQILV